MQKKLLTNQLVQHMLSTVQSPILFQVLLHCGPEEDSPQRGRASVRVHSEPVLPERAGSRDHQTKPGRGGRLRDAHLQQRGLHHDADVGE